MKFEIHAIVSIGAILCSSFDVVPLQPEAPVFPYKNAGLTDSQAAAHLISRFTYGATPGQVDNVVRVGLENWFHWQLKGGLKDDQVDILLKDYEALKLSNTEIVNTYWNAGQVLRMANKDGVIKRDSLKTNRGDYRDELNAYMQQKGIKSERELMRQFINQKIWRSIYSENQLQEVLTEFWFNHFNVSLTKKICTPLIPGYERDVIRPNALGQFQDLLIATAKSPAMLLYLDNFISVGAKDNPKKNKTGQTKRMKGLNENYAREVMELHTLGVDGGYTQTDITEAAKILTGWTIYPMGREKFGNANLTMQDDVDEKLKVHGVFRDGDFLFTPNRHDAREKTVLGKHFPAGGGYEEGIQLLRLLASHESTARFIAKKIAVRFVNDDPASSLIGKMAKTFQETNGDIKEVLITMVSSAEFWDESALRAKTKSPLELVISSIRALNGEVRQPYKLYTWIDRMGQPLYAYQAPTGFPDRGQYWINTGSLLNRMNFGLALADGIIPGVTFNLLELNKNHEPESAEDALITYSKLLMPGRNTVETVKRLSPLLNDPELQQKVEKAASHTNENNKMEKDQSPSINSFIDETYLNQDNETVKAVPRTKYRLSQVIGILIGSPEFQRR